VVGPGFKIWVEQAFYFGIVIPCLIVDLITVKWVGFLPQENNMSEIVHQESQTIIKPGMDVVASMAEDFKIELLSVINESSTDVVIDLEGVEMLDSVGIGVIIAAHNTLNQSDRKLKVINVVKDVYGLFATMRLNRRFTVEGIG
jgi:anti-anti-sigma factor